MNINRFRLNAPFHVMLILDANRAWASLLSGCIRLPLSPCMFLVFMWKQALPARAWPEGGSVISCGRQAGNNWWGVVEEKQAVNTLPYDNSKRQAAAWLLRRNRRGKNEWLNHNPPLKLSALSGGFVFSKAWELGCCVFSGWKWRARERYISNASLPFITLLCSSGAPL